MPQRSVPAMLRPMRGTGRGALRRKLASEFLDRLGWKTIGEKPTFKKYVFIAAPHTSNWDLPVMLAFAAKFDMSVSWLGKHTLFEGPMGPIMKRVGGVPIDRRQKNNTVEQVAAVFAEREELALAVPPEGTRGYRDYWKSGFYQIAKAANVPICMGTIDYGRRQAGFGGHVIPTGDISADMDKIRAFYVDKVGYYPALFGPVRLKAEIETSEKEAAEQTGAP